MSFTEQLDKAFQKACPSSNYMVDGFGRQPQPDPVPDPEPRHFRAYVTVCADVEAIDRDEAMTKIRELIGRKVDVIEYDWD